jgi:hypothetical protein
MNSHTATLLRTIFAVLALTLTGVVATAPAGAADRFLESPVPILAEPENRHPSGGYDLVQAENGEAVAVWGQSNGLYVSVRLPGGDFGEPVLAVPGQAYSSNPELAIAPDGYTVMTWRQSVSGKSQVMRAVRQPGAPNFGAALQVSDEPFQIPNIDPQIAIADDRSALLVWKGQEIDGDDTSTRIRKRYLTPQGALAGAVTNVSAASPVGNAFPDVFMGPAGHALVTWMVGTVPTGDQAACWMEPGGGSPDTQVFDTDSGTLLKGAVDAAGNAVVANRVGNALIGNSRPAGSGQNFQFDQALDLPGTGPATPSVEMDGEGNTTVAFGYFGGGVEGIQVVERPAGAGQLFGTAVKVIAETTDVNDVSLAVGEQGNALIGYTLPDDRVYALSRDSGAAGFSQPTGPVSPVAETGIVAASADGNGKGLVTYSTFDVPADDYTISALPYDDVPVATGLSIPATARQGDPVSFSVQPADAWSPVTGIEWNLGEGVTKSGSQVSHTYQSPGQRPVTVTLTDNLGNQTVAGGTITVTPVTPPDTVRPKLTKVSMLRKRSRRGKRNAFRFTLSERARIVIKVKRTSKGKGKKAQGRIVRKNVAAGKRRVFFRGKISRRKLKPARYRARIVAIDKAGNRSRPRKLGFRIIR